MNMMKRFCCSWKRFKYILILYAAGYFCSRFSPTFSFILVAWSIRWQHNYVDWQKVVWEEFSKAFNFIHSTSTLSTKDSHEEKSFSFNIFLKPTRDFFLIALDKHNFVLTLLMLMLRCSEEKRMKKSKQTQHTKCSFYVIIIASRIFAFFMILIERFSLLFLYVHLTVSLFPSNTSIHVLFK